MLQLTFLLLCKHLINKTQNHEVYGVHPLSTSLYRLESKHQVMQGL